MSQFSKRTIQTDGYETVFYESGNQNEQETLLLLHGGGPGATSMSNWKGILPKLGRRFHVLAPDLRGFGLTDHPEDPPTNMLAWMSMRVNQIVALLDELGIEKAHLVGNSMGGALALNLIIEQSERFDRVVLMGSAGGTSEFTSELYRMANFYANPTPTALQNLFKWFVYDESILGDELEQITAERFEEVMRPEVRRSYEAMFQGVPYMTIPHSALRRMNHPFFVIHGKDDRFVNFESSMEIFKQLPNAQLHVFDRCGHWVQLEREKEFLKLISDFFSGELGTDN